MKPGVRPPLTAEVSSCACSCATSWSAVVAVEVNATVNDAVGFAFSSPPESPTSLSRCWLAPGFVLWNVIT